MTEQGNAVWPKCQWCGKKAGRKMMTRQRHATPQEVATSERLRTRARALKLEADDVRRERDSESVQRAIDLKLEADALFANADKYAWIGTDDDEQRFSTVKLKDSGKKYWFHTEMVNTGEPSTGTWHLIEGLWFHSVACVKHYARWCVKVLMAHKLSPYPPRQPDVTT